jgi:hypothetical protein
MRVKIASVFIALQMVLGAGAAADAICTGPRYTDDQIREIIRRERFIREDLPGGFAESTTKINRRRCHYVYIESSVPLRPGLNLIFKLNQYGVIVDARGVGH